MENEWSPDYVQSRTRETDTNGVRSLSGIVLGSRILTEYRHAHNTANHPLQATFKDTLGAEGVLPSRQIEGFLRDFKQFACILPSGQIES